MEIYSFDRYKGYNLFVEVVELDEDSEYDYLYEGVAQYDGTTIHTSKSLLSGDTAELFLKDKIDKEEELQNEIFKELANDSW